MSGLLHRAVLATRRVPGLSALYRGVYGGATWASARAFASVPGVDGVHLHRGLSRPGWEPGVSDIDLLLVRRGEGRAGEHELLRGVAPRLRSLRRTFPMLGDLWIGSRSEYSNYLAWGGMRAWEDSPDWKRLAGEPLPRPRLLESGGKRRWLDPWVWLFVSQMEVSRRVFARGGARDAKGQADARKLYLDVWRLSEHLLDDGSTRPASREEARARAPLDRDLSALWLDGSLRLARASRRVLARAACAHARSTVFPAPPSDGGLLARLAAAPASCAVSAQPYHTFVVLEDGADARAHGRLAERIIAESVAGVPLVVERSTFALALQSSYLGAPLGWLGSGGGGASPEGESLFPGWSPRAAGAPLGDLPLLPESWRWQSAAEASSWMALWWRYLWISPGWSNRFVLFHLYTRALGLRLALRGEETGPFGDWELLIARAAAAFPEESRRLLRVRTLLLEERPADLDSDDRARVQLAHVDAVSGILAGAGADLAAAETPGPAPASDAGPGPNRPASA
ncbi:MAG: hypothetical protein HY078_08845 [Elusimicrobia bacterium]|nr:hypothetical protein [Elusimicrobiota bacterium]